MSTSTSMSTTFNPDTLASQEPSHSSPASQSHPDQPAPISLSVAVDPVRQQDHPSQLKSSSVREAAPSALSSAAPVSEWGGVASTLLDLGAFRTGTDNLTARSETVSRSSDTTASEIITPWGSPAHEERYWGRVLDSARATLEYCKSDPKVTFEERQASSGRRLTAEWTEAGAMAELQRLDKSPHEGPIQRLTPDQIDLFVQLGQAEQNLKRSEGEDETCLTANDLDARSVLQDQCMSMIGSLFGDVGHWKSSRTTTDAAIEPAVRSQAQSLVMSLNQQVWLGHLHNFARQLASYSDGSSLGSTPGEASVRQQRILVLQRLVSTIQAGLGLSSTPLTRLEGCWGMEGGADGSG